MMRMEHAGAFLVVEGVTDMRFWRPRRWAECELVNGEGKKNVIGGVRRLDVDSFGGVLGIVDDDCDSLMDVDFGTGNVVRTDGHDLECLLCRSSALEKVLAEYGDESKIGRFERNAGTDVRSALLERALVFGRLRFAVRRNRLDIERSAIRVPRFVDARTWTVDEQGLIRALVKDGSTCDEDVVERCIAQLPVVDPWRVVRGHDMVSILRIGLGRVLGNVGAGIGEEQISSILRSGFTPADLQATTLWADMRAWEAGNRRFGFFGTEHGACRNPSAGPRRGIQRSALDAVTGR